MKYAFLIPIYNTISGRLLPQFLHLQEWCRNLDGEIFTVVGRTHVDARNWLCTDGGGYTNPTKLIDKFDNLVWIDADQQFNYQQLCTLLESGHDFCSGWYIKELSGLAMIADWDEDYFESNLHMKFHHQDEIRQREEPFEASYCGFGFTKVSSNIMRELEYPYFRQRMVTIGDHSENCSEDVTFCLDVWEKCGIKPTILPELRVNHLKEMYI